MEVFINLWKKNINNSIVIHINYQNSVGNLHAFLYTLVVKGTSLKFLFLLF